jgi:hypothetical protein
VARSTARTRLVFAISLAGTSSAWQPSLAQSLDAAEAAMTAIAGSSEKSVSITRAAEAPTLDGVLDPAEWAQAAVVEDLHEIQPNEYAAPSERTRVYLMYDDDALYIGARLFDDQPDKILARVLRQGDDIMIDDWFSVVIDPFHDRRSGYRFQTNPNGLRQEALFQNVSDEQWNWEGIWYSAAKIDDKGWVAEMAIPFKTLSFDPSNDTWGINFRRSVARRDERMGWVSRNRATDPSTSGIAVGFDGLKQGAGLDVVPSVAVNTRHDVAAGIDESELNPSVDVFYKITPSLTGSLTINTDFSATEVDNRQVNLSRFALFYPEKRDFFLQDADIFEFGRIDQNGRPFFSRRIGIDVNGGIVDIEAGAKISGRIGRWNIGALSIRQNASQFSPADNATVARVSANVLRESTVGVIMTEGNPQGVVGNSVVGTDFLYRNTRLPGGHILEGEAWVQRSDTEGISGDDKAYGFGFRSPNKTGLRGGFRFSEFEKNFNPGLGFVNRVGIRQVEGGLHYRARPRSGFVRAIDGGLHIESVENITGGLQSKQFRVTLLGLESRDGDNVEVNWATNTEVLVEPFEIYPGVVIPVGEYEFDERRVNFFSADQRRLSGGVGFQTGGFYGGNRDQIFGSLAWRPGPHFSTRIEYQINDVLLPQGAFTTRLVAIRGDVAFSAKLSWVNLIQYDNVSEILGINSRLQWVPEPGREAFLVLNRNLEDYDRDGSFHNAYSEAAIKFSYTFRF